MSEAVRPGKIDPRDVLAIDALLDDEEKLVRDTVRRFVHDRILPEVAEWYEEGVFPKEIVKEMGSLGLLGMHLEGYGCAGTSAVAYGLASTELEAGDTGTRSFVSVQGSLAMFPIWAFGSEEQKQEWLPQMAAGDVVGCFGLTEADSGSDPGSMRTHARSDGADWVLNGSKMWITNGSIADVAVVWARTDDGIRGFVVPTDTPGFSTNLIHHKMSLRASITSELVLADVRLPAELMLIDPTMYEFALDTVLAAANAGMGAIFTGVARSAFEEALAYTKVRVQGGKPICEHQLVQKQLFDMFKTVEACRALSRHALAYNATNIPPQTQYSIASKTFCTDACFQVASTALGLFGGYGLSREYPIEKIFRDARASLIEDGTNDVLSLAGARLVLDRY